MTATDKLTEAEVLAKTAWRGRPLVDRQAHMPKILVMHPQFSKAVREIKHRVSRACTQKKGAALSVVAETGGGKSTLIKFIEETYPNAETEDRSIRQCVSFTVPPRPSSVSMSSTLLRSLGDPRWDKGDSDVLETRAIHLLRECGAKVVLIDNIHDVPERRKRKGVREVGNWVRTFIDQVPALFVSLGAAQGLDVFKANNQARRRNPAHVRMDYFDCRNTPGVARFRRFLFELDKQLPLAEMSKLSVFDTTTRIWMATYGIPDYVNSLLTEAVEFAFAAGREAIELSDLSNAFKQLYLDAAPETNPFESGTRLRVLDGENEPFENWLNDGYE